MSEASDHLLISQTLESKEVFNNLLESLGIESKTDKQGDPFIQYRPDKSDPNYVIAIYPKDYLGLKDYAKLTGEDENIKLEDIKKKLQKDPFYIARLFLPKKEKKHKRWILLQVTL